MTRPRRFYLDIFGGDPPVPGDFLVGARKAYLVLEVRPVDSRVWEDRWHVTARATDRETVMRGTHPDMEVGSTLHSFSSYRRGETPMEFARRKGYA